MTLKDQTIARCMRRPPDFIIGTKNDPYLLRWFVVPCNPIFNIYRHIFKRSDDDRARHTHPWLFNISLLYRGGYREWFGDGPTDYVDRRAPHIKFRWGGAPHRIELTHGDCETIFITGPRVRQWGFLCPQGFVHWKKFTKSDNPGEVGKGCDA
jgi:hypothetical protein